jgi:hypothetical protein
VNPRSRKEHAILRRRRLVQPALVAILRAVHKANGPGRRRVMMQFYAVGEGIAYVPSDAVPRAGEHVEVLGPTGSGKTYIVASGLPAPSINAATWMDQEHGEDDEYDPHTYDRLCPVCGPCEAAPGDPDCYCCGCEERRAEYGERVE